MENVYTLIWIGYEGENLESVHRTFNGAKAEAANLFRAMTLDYKELDDKTTQIFADRNLVGFINKEKLAPQNGILASGGLSQNQPFSTPA